LDSSATFETRCISTPLCSSPPSRTLLLTGIRVESAFVVAKPLEEDALKVTVAHAVDLRFARYRSHPQGKLLAKLSGGCRPDGPVARGAASEPALKRAAGGRSASYSSWSHALFRRERQAPQLETLLDLADRLP
jgi:hypothetical protein